MRFRDDLVDDLRLNLKPLLEADGVTVHPTGRAAKAPFILCRYAGRLYSDPSRPVLASLLVMAHTSDTVDPQGTGTLIETVVDTIEEQVGGWMVTAETPLLGFSFGSRSFDGVVLTVRCL